jgi:predicted short-subunit dehydrogenase-like oxidoreductase (DUF2520 family)
MSDVSIIGAGRVGTTLGFALSKTGHSIKALSSKSLLSVKQSKKIIGQGRASTDNIYTARAGETVFLCLPDEAIQKVCQQIANSDINWKDKCVFHCSGLWASDILRPLKAKGASIASLHPIQSFAQKKADLKIFKGVYFGLEGDKDALALSTKIVRQLKGHPLILQTKDKPIYHTACSIASNYFVVILDMAVSLLKQISVPEENALQILFPLVKGTLHNVKNLNTGSSLTGPAVRGDIESIQKHLKALKKYPLYQEIYSGLALQALKIAKKEKRISPKKTKLIENLLGEK